MIKVFIELDINTEEQQSDEMLKMLIEHHIKQIFFVPPEVRRIDIQRISDERIV